MNIEEGGKISKFLDGISTLFFGVAVGGLEILKWVLGQLQAGDISTWAAVGLQSILWAALIWKTIEGARKKRAERIGQQKENDKKEEEDES